jgi:hypothetical protein
MAPTPQFKKELGKSFFGDKEVSYLNFTLTWKESNQARTS